MLPEKKQNLFKEILPRLRLIDNRRKILAKLQENAFLLNLNLPSIPSQGRI